MMGIHGVTGQDLRALQAQSQPRASQEGYVQEKPERMRPPSDASSQRADKAQRQETRPAHKQLEIPGTARAGTKLRVDDATERIVAQILDQNREVIKQIPPESQLKIIARTRQIQGLLFDEMA